MFDKLCLISHTFLGRVISIHIYGTEETKKDKNVSKYQDLKTNTEANTSRWHNGAVSSLE